MGAARPTVHPSACQTERAPNPLESHMNRTKAYRLAERANARLTATLRRSP